MKRHFILVHRNGIIELTEVNVGSAPEIGQSYTRADGEPWIIVKVFDAGTWLLREMVQKHGMEVVSDLFRFQLR